jgi:hypothetical protein
VEADIGRQSSSVSRFYRWPLIDVRRPIRPHIGTNHTARGEFNLTAEQRERLVVQERI